MFHGRTNYVKLQVKYIRRLFEGDYESIDKFSAFLMVTLKTWKAFQVTPWLNNESNAKLCGEHTKDFTRCTHKICEKLKSLQESSECDTLCKALYAYEKVHCFISFVIIDDYITANAFFGRSLFSEETEKIYIGEKMIEEFQRLTSHLYDCGMKTFLTDRVPGDHETFYAHAVRWYFPKLLKRTYNKYGLGLGVFSMEGFEAINYMTKRFIRDHTNRRGNICFQTMVRIVLTYINHDHDVHNEIAAKAKQKKKNLETINRIHHFENERLELV